MEGHLELQQGFFRLWNYHYAVLHHSQLLLLDKKAGKVLMTLNLQQGKLVYQQSELPVFQLHLAQEYKLRADSKESSLKWIGLIRKALQKTEQDYFKNKEYFNVLTQGNNHSETLLAEVWQIQAEIDQTIVLFKSKHNLNKTEQGILNKISKLTDSLKKKVRLIVEQGKVQIPDSNNSFNEQQEFFYQLGEQEDFRSFRSYSMKDNFTYNKTETNSIKPRFSKPSSLTLAVSDPIKNTLLNSNEVFIKTAQDIGTVTQRLQMPYLIDPKVKLNFFSMCKQIVGKDLTRITMPVNFNEPLSQLQRIASKFMFKKLLEDANKEKQPCKRIALAAAFEMTSCFIRSKQVRKSFNPLLGQTYELILDPNTKFLAEQVSHHPPVSSYHCSGPSFSVEETIQMSSQFRINYVNVILDGQAVITLKSPQMKIRFTRPVVSLGGIVYGDNNVEISGNYHFKASSGEQIIINFQSGSWLSRNQNKIDGWVTDCKGKKRYLLQGIWDSYLNLIDSQSLQSTVLWKAPPQQLKHEEYNFTHFDKQLNYLTSDLFKRIAPTDSRLRPDQRALEFGLMELAASQKHRLQEKQRQRRKEYEKKSITHSARWFVKTSDKSWRFKDQYWAVRSRTNFGESLDIF